MGLANMSIGGSYVRDLKIQRLMSVDQTIAHLHARIFESAGRDNSVIETPDDMCHHAAQLLETAKDLIETMLENDPTEPISDAGHVMLDLWRHDARAFLDRQQPTNDDVNTALAFVSETEDKDAG